MNRFRPGHEHRVVARVIAGGLAVAGVWTVCRHLWGTGDRGALSPSHAAIAHGYETEDIEAGAVARVLLALAVSAGLLTAVVFVMIALMGNGDQARNATFTLKQIAQIEPPLPHLQVHPFADLHALRARETRRLHGYGFTDQAHTRARIPIARAMTLLVGQSLDASP